MPPRRGFGQNASITAQALCSVAKFSLRRRLGWLQCVFVVSLIAQRHRNEVLGEKLRHVIVPPRGVDRLDQGLRLIAVKDKSDLPVTIVIEALRSGRWADFFSVDDHRRPGRIRSDGVPSLDAP